MGLTVLFTHLKILLQWISIFNIQFLVFSCIQTDPNKQLMQQQETRPARQLVYQLINACWKSETSNLD